MKLNHFVYKYGKKFKFKNSYKKSKIENILSQTFKTRLDLGEYSLT